MSKTIKPNVRPRFLVQRCTQLTCNRVGLSSDEQSEQIKELARKATTYAANDALKNGRAITIQQGNDIVKKFPDGRIEVIKTLENAFVVPKKLVYKL
ncbi:MAG: hypothetical protein WBL02_04105 [Methanomethylovorans sp.]|uniref:hypothetical protein n=1 Tax=Methanomethylovorans sp. TaxID=2758717 RepID=UPI000A99B0B1|nr:hypothetical protein [Methanomethylovorans sp.]